MFDKRWIIISFALDWNNNSVGSQVYIVLNQTLNILKSLECMIGVRKSEKCCCMFLRKNKWMMTITNKGKQQVLRVVCRSQNNSRRWRIRSCILQLINPTHNFETRRLFPWIFLLVGNDKESMLEREEVHNRTGKVTGGINWRRINKRLKNVDRQTELK